MLTVNTVVPSPSSEVAVDDFVFAETQPEVAEQVEHFAEEASDAGQESPAVAGRIGCDNEGQEQLSETERPRHSAKVHLELRLNSTKEVIGLGQVGPSFVIVDRNQVGDIPVGSEVTIVIVVDDKETVHTAITNTPIDPVSGRLGITMRPTVNDEIAAASKADHPRQAELDARKADDGSHTSIKTDETFWAEVKLLGQLRECESTRDQLETTLADNKATRARLQMELQQVEVAIPKIEQSVEDARDQTLAVAKQLWRLKATGELPTPVQAAATDTAAQSESESQSAAATDPAADESWREVATRELLTSQPPIAGLGKKKLENIIDAAPTVGHLVDLISEGSKAHKQFHEMLPKGCGRGLADEIEKRIGDLVIQRAKDASLGTVSALADELLKGQRQMAASEQWRPEDCQPSSDDSEHWKMGFAAFNEGKLHHALPTQNRDLARQWILGWVCAEVIKHKSDEPASKPVEAAEPVDGNVELSDAESVVAASDVAVEAAVAPQKKERKPRAKKAK